MCHTQIEKVEEENLSRLGQILLSHTKARVLIRSKDNRIVASVGEIRSVNTCIASNETYPWVIGRNA